MLKKFDTREIISSREAQKKYSTQHLAMVITEMMNHGQDYLGYVLYASEDEREIAHIPRSAYESKQMGFLSGIDTEPYPQIEKVVYYD